MLMENNIVLQTQRGKKHAFPEIKNLAIEFFMMQAVKNGELPFKHRTGYNSNRSHSFLELFNDDSLFHFNQVRSKSMCARKAECRDRHIRPLSSYINIDEQNNANIECDNQRYFQLNHGYQSSNPSFITLGIPNRKGVLEGTIFLLEEYRVVEGFYPKSKIESLDDFSFEEFQRFAEGDNENATRKTS